MGIMRITGGFLKGGQISTPKKIRITSSKAKGCIFDILKDEISGKRVLDLYSGSGNLGIEAFSRGAVEVTFVEKNPGCIRYIKNNLKILPEDLDKKAKIFKFDVLRAIPKFKKNNIKFDIVFIDPPFYKGISKNCLLKIDSCDILIPCAWVVVQHYKADILPDVLNNMALKKYKSYQDVSVSFYRTL